MENVDLYGTSREIEYRLNLAGWMIQSEFCEYDADVCGWLIRATKETRALLVKEYDRTVGFQRLERKIARLK